MDSRIYVFQWNPGYITADYMKFIDSSRSLSRFTLKIIKKQLLVMIFPINYPPREFGIRNPLGSNIRDPQSTTRDSESSGWDLESDSLLPDSFT